MKKIIRSCLEVIFDLLFPASCLGCQKLGSYLCPNCYRQIDFYPFPPQLDLEKDYLDSLIVSAHYAQPLSQLIIAFKYQGAQVLAPFLAELIWYSTALPQVDLVTFVPLHPKKLKLRGYNQTQLLATALSQKMNVACLPTLEKVTHHRAQAETPDRQQRLTNVNQTFKLDPNFSNWYQTQIPPPQSVLIIDDVITTGATLNEVARLLKTIGEIKVYGYALAHD